MKALPEARLLQGYNPTEQNFVDTTGKTTAVLSALQEMKRGAQPSKSAIEVAPKGNGWER